MTSDFFENLKKDIERINGEYLRSPDSAEVTSPTEIKTEIIQNSNSNNGRPPPRQAAVNNSAIFQDRGTGSELIELVKSYPELYDKTHTLYANNSHKGVIWSKIAKDLNTGSGMFVPLLISSIQEEL